MTTTPLKVDVPSPDMLVGTRVHMLMWERGVKQIALAPKLGITQTGLSKKLKGRVGWSVSDLIAVARELDTTVAYLVGESENRHPDLPNGGSQSVVHPPGLEPGTHCFLVSDEHEEGPDADVIPLAPLTGGVDRERDAEVVAFPTQLRTAETEAVR